MTKEQKKAVVDKKEGGYEKWENGLKELELLVYLKKYSRRKNI